MPDDVKPVSAAPSLLDQVMAKIPPPLRRVSAMAAGVALPFLAGLARQHGIAVDTNEVLAAEGVLAVYLGQSVVNTIHARTIDAAPGKGEVLS